MSFYSGTRQCCFPGPITGNPLQGLCEKVAIEAKKVFDACMKQIQETNVVVTVTDYVPANPALPLTFVSATCSSGTVPITNLSINRFEDRPCFARVTGEVNLPITITYTDANGVSGTATANITVDEDVVLYVPQPSVVPFTVEAFATCMGVDGDYTGENEFTLDACITLILKVVCPVDILVPSYGYAKIPPCQEFTQDVCTGFFELPLFPAQQTILPNGQ